MKICFPQLFLSPQKCRKTQSYEIPVSGNGTNAYMEVKILLFLYAEGENEKVG